MTDTVPRISWNGTPKGSLEINTMSGDDDLRFGDVEGSGRDESIDPIQLMQRLIIGAIMLYVLLAVVETLFGIPIPFV